MHIAAALDKPIVCFFGDSDPSRWRPWSVPCQVLRPSTRVVADISLAEVVDAWHGLASEAGW